MLTIEEYIARRKKEDNLSEFSLNDRMENMKICVNYVFEYFNQYLDDSKMNEATILNNERLEKYRNTIAQYEPELQEWLIHIFDEYGKMINLAIKNFLKKDELLHLYYTESEFRNLSYDCYAELIKKHSFLKDQSEMIFLFIKDYHQLHVAPLDQSDNLSFSEEIDHWLNTTRQKYKVDIKEFCYEWVNRFFDNEALWPVTHRKKINNGWREYEYDYRQKHNLFNLNPLYKRISDKPFVKGKKQYLEVIMMYYWLHLIEDDSDNYWQDYMSKCLVN